MNNKELRELYPVAVYEVEVSKKMGTLAQYCSKTDIRLSLTGVALDIDAGRAVATDGYKLRIKPLKVVSKTQDVGECIIIPVKDWREICRMAGAGAILKIEKYQVGKNNNVVYYYNFHGLEGRNIFARYPNYHSVIPRVNEGARVRLSCTDWKEAKKILATYKKNKEAKVTIMQKNGNVEIIVSVCEGEVLYRATFKPEKVAAFDFALLYSIAPLVQLSQLDIYVPCAYTRPLVAVDGADLVLIMPLLYDKEVNITPLYDYKGLQGDFDPLTAPANEKIGSAVVDASPAEKENATAKKATAKEVAPKKAAAKKLGGYDFGTVGIKPGDTLQFVDGTEVTAVDGGKVEYKGETYTLTGFCKQFMPADRRCKSGAYRGPLYFTFGGVRLDRLAKGIISSATTAPKRKEQKAGSTEKQKAVKRPGTTAKEVAPVSVQPTNVEPNQVSEHTDTATTELVERPRLSIIDRLRRFAAAVLFTALAVIGFSIWNEFAPVQELVSVGVHQSAVPAFMSGAVGSLAAVDAPNVASIPVIGTAENHRNNNGYPFGATDLGARSAATLVTKQTK